MAKIMRIASGLSLWLLCVGAVVARCEEQAQERPKPGSAVEAIDKRYAEEEATTPPPAPAPVETRAWKPVTPAEQKQLDEARRLNGRVYELWRAGKYREAIPLAEQALSVRRELLGDEHLETALSLFNLAAQYQGLAEYSKAEPLYWQALDIRGTALGRAHPDYAASLNSLATLYRSMGEDARAEPSHATSLTKLAGLYSSSGEYAKAEPLHLQAIDTRKKALGEAHPDYATSLHSLAVVYRLMGEYAKAEPLFLQARDIRKKALGEAHPDYAASLNSLAVLYWSMREYAKAEPLFLQSHEIHKNNFGEAHPDYAASLNNLAELYRSTGEYTKAELLHRQALDLMKKALGEAHPKYAASLNNLALLHHLIGEYHKAEPLYVQAREIRKKALGKDHPDYAASLANLAGLYESMGEYSKAEPLARKALNIYKTVVGETHPGYAHGLTNLANLYESMGEYARAEPLYIQALDITRKALGEDHPWYAASLNNLGGLHQSMGAYTKAEPLYLQVRNITKKTLGEAHPDYAASLNNLAGLYGSMGEFARAESFYLEARNITKKALGEDHPKYATSLNNLAVLYKKIGEYAQAEPLYLQARNIMKKALGEDHPDYATSLNNLAAVYSAMGEYDKAERLILEAVAIRKKALGEAHPNYAASLNDLAALYHSVDEYAKAERLYSRAQALRKQTLGEDHPEYAASLSNLAYLYDSMGEYAKAEPLFRDALSRELVVAQRTLPWLSEARAFSLLRDLNPSPQDWLITLRKLPGDQAADAYAAVWHTRAVVTRMLAQRRRQIADSAEGESLWVELQSTQQQLAQLTLATVQPEQRTARQERLRELSDQKERLEGEVAKVSQDFRRQGEISKATPQTLAQALPEGAALVEFLAPCIDQTGERDGRDASGGVYQVFVLRRTAEAPFYTVAWVQLGPAQPIEAALDEWRAAIMGKAPVSATDEHKTPAEARLRAAVWDPIEPHLAGCSHVYLVPDGPLSFLPWAALPGREPGGCLLDDYALATVGYGQQLYELLTASKSPSEQVLLAGGMAYDEAPAAPPPSPGTMLASADRGPASGGSTPPMDGRMTWNYLPGSRAEVDNIVALRTAPPAPRVLTGPEASEATLRQWMPHSRYIHLATHGFFADERFRSATQHHVEGERLFGHGMEPMNHRAAHGAHVTARNPLILSGLVLAGANLPPKTDPLGLPTGEDGILTAEEIVGLDLRGTELVVLSACDTGLGNVAGGEGVMGLQRAFHLAGARNVIASLWKVDDHATAVLMRLFYENLWQQRMPPQAALRDAQLTLYHNPDLLKTSPEALRAGRLDRPVPLPDGAARPPQAAKTPVRHWAAFVLSGSGQ